MRVAADEDDPDFWFDHYPQGVDIFFGGVKVDEVVEADDVAGFVVIVEHDARGHPIHKDGAFVHRRLSGSVAIVPRGLPGSGVAS